MSDSSVTSNESSPSCSLCQVASRAFCGANFREGGVTSIRYACVLPELLRKLDPLQLYHRPIHWDPVHRRS